MRASATTATDIARATDDDDDDDDDVSNDARTRVGDRIPDATRAARVVVVDECALVVARMRTARARPRVKSRHDRDGYSFDASHARARVSRVSRPTAWTWPS